MFVSISGGHPELVTTKSILGTSKQGISKQGGTTFAWRSGSQYDVAVTRGADSVLSSDCRAQFGRPSTRRGCCICVTVRLPVRQRGQTMYWQANANTRLSVTPPFKCARQSETRFLHYNGRGKNLGHGDLEESKRTKVFFFLA